MSEENDEITVEELTKIEQPKFTTLKATKDTANRLKILAAEKKMKMYELLEELIPK